MAMGSCVHIIPTSITNQFSKFPVSSISHFGSGLDTVNNGRRRGSLCGNASFRVRGRCFFNGKSNYSLCCKSQLTSDLAPAASAAYGILLLGGGLFAYTRSGSKGSLLGGLTGGALMGTAYFLMQASETKEIGDALAFGSALLFASVFGIRLAATRKIIPAGPLLGLSICSLAVFISAYLQDKL